MSIQEQNNTFAVDAILPSLRAAGARQVLQIAAAQAARDLNLPESYILEKLILQEDRSPSGIGGGVAIPHLRLRRLERPYRLLARLAGGVDFRAIDNQPADLVFLLLSPKEDVAAHLYRLSRVTRLLRDAALCANLRTTQGADGILAVLMNSAEDRRAA